MFVQWKTNLINDLQAFFLDFCNDFSQFDGELIARRYATPYLAVSAEGELQSFASPEETAGWFQQHLDSYRARGCARCSFTSLEAVALGQHKVLATVTWHLRDADGSLVNTWRVSYNLLCRDGRWLIYTSTDHS